MLKRKTRLPNQRKFIFLPCWCWVWLLFTHTNAWSQTESVEKINPQDTLPAGIQSIVADNQVKFSPQVRALRQVAGAPEAFYTYFWDLGDGRFSFENEPTHHYRDTGTYQVRLYATNNYDDGKAPPTKPRPVKIKSKTQETPATWASHFFKSDGSVELKINRSPKPGEDFVLLAGYRNQQSTPLNGSLVLFFNEKQFAHRGFALEEKRLYHGEDSSNMQTLLARMDAKVVEKSWAMRSGPAANQLTANQQEGIATTGFFHASVFAGQSYYTGYSEQTKTMIQLLQANYSDNNVVHFSNLAAGKEQFMFLTINTLPEMIQDTNATVTMGILYIPDDITMLPELFELEMEVVASHDPNRLQLKQRMINYRFMGKNKELNYKVRFQNTGKGPAKMVKIGIDIPPQLNTASLEIKSMSPACTWCDSAYNNQSCLDTIRTPDSLYFIFKNIYLPGLQQEGVSDKDSTKGFVEYSLRFKKRPKKLPFESRAAIVFDKNEPIFTNRSKAKFVKGFSPGIMAGYAIPLNKDGLQQRGPIKIGFQLTPFAPSRPYFQFEVHAGFGVKEKSPTTIVRTQRDTVVNAVSYLINSRELFLTYDHQIVEFVPLHYRYNLNNWMGIGVGAHVQLQLSTKTTLFTKTFLTDLKKPDMIAATIEKSELQPKEWFTSWHAAPFVDLQIGRVRQGPAVGARYMRPLQNKETGSLQVYGVFRL